MSCFMLEVAGESGWTVVKVSPAELPTCRFCPPSDPVRRRRGRRKETRLIQDSVSSTYTNSRKIFERAGSGFKTYLLI